MQLYLELVKGEVHLSVFNDKLAIKNTTSNNRHYYYYL